MTKVDRDQLRDLYRNFSTLPLIRSQITRITGVDHGVIGQGLDDITDDDALAVKTLLAVAHEAWGARHNVDLNDTVDVLNDVRRLQRKAKAQSIFDTEQAGETDFDDLYLTRTQVAEIPRGEPLVTDIIDRNTYFVVVGRDQSYKSFLIVDWLACIATGKTWQGHDVEHGPVLYVVGEGAWGLDDRLTAWEQASGQKVPDDMFHVRRAPVNLYKTDSQAMADLVERVEREGYVAVVFDTLQRCSTGADSNSTRDAGQIVASLDRVRDATNEGSVGVVAHSDKSDRDTRGSSAFEDDADIVVRVKKDEDTQSVTVTLDKRKDGPAGKTWELQPFKPPYAPSIVLEARGAQPKNTKPPSQAYPALVQLSKPVFKDDGASVTALQLALGLGGKGSIYPALNYLLDEGLASKHGPRTSVRYKITVQGWSALERAEGNDR